MTNNQLTDERLTAVEVAQAVAVVSSERTSGPFDVAANVSTLDERDGGLEITAAMAEAGATWTLDLTPDTLAQHRELIRRGPPREVATRLRRRG